MNGSDPQGQSMADRAVGDAGRRSWKCSTPPSPTSSLPHIAGSLSVTTDEATWVLTSYLVSNAIVIPSQRVAFGQRFGRKRFLHVLHRRVHRASFLCGLATSLPMLLVLRVMQGAGGGALQPIAQSILLESFPRKNTAWPWAFTASAW